MSAADNVVGSGHQHHGGLHVGPQRVHELPPIDRQTLLAHRVIKELCGKLKDDRPLQLSVVRDWISHGSSASVSRGATHPTRLISGMVNAIMRSPAKLLLITYLDDGSGRGRSQGEFQLFDGRGVKLSFRLCLMEDADAELLMCLVPMFPQWYSGGAIVETRQYFNFPHNDAWDQYFPRYEFCQTLYAHLVHIGVASMNVDSAVQLCLDAVLSCSRACISELMYLKHHTAVGSREKQNRQNREKHLCGILAYHNQIEATLSSNSRARSILDFVVWHLIMSGVLDETDEGDDGSGSLSVHPNRGQEVSSVPVG